MKKKLLDLSGKIDDLTVSFYETVIRVIENLNIQYFVVGASARDIIFQYGYDIKPIRATRDIDIGIYISSWNDFDKLSNKLIESGKFIKSKESQRFLYNDSIWLDVIPFGSIENNESSVVWPPENVTHLNVLGYKEAFNNTIYVRLKFEPPLDIKVASIPGLVILKLISFSDRSSLSNKDASDLAYIIDNYIDAGNQERLFEEHRDLLDEDEFKFNLAGARMLGRDISRIISQDTKQAIIEILESETDDNGKLKLVSQMKDRASDEISDEVRLNQLIELKTGIEEF